MSSIVPNLGPILVTGSGALTPAAPYCTMPITYAGVAAMTLAAPVEDGIEVTLIDETGHAHTLVVNQLNAGTSNNKLTWNGTAGSSAVIFSRNGAWWTVALNGVAVS